MTERAGSPLGSALVRTIAGSCAESSREVSALVRRGEATLRALPLSAMRLGVPVVLVHRRRAFLSGAARTVIAILRDG